MCNAEDEDNAKILRDLFEGTGIMSAIDHSKIESANDPETRAIDYEASRIARQAAEALRQSRRVRICCCKRCRSSHQIYSFAKHVIASACQRHCQAL